MQWWCQRKFTNRFSPLLEKFHIQIMYFHFLIEVSLRLSPSHLPRLFSRVKFSSEGNRKVGIKSCKARKQKKSRDEKWKIIAFISGKLSTPKTVIYGFLLRPAFRCMIFISLKMMMHWHGEEKLNVINYTSRCCLLVSFVSHERMKEENFNLDNVALELAIFPSGNFWHRAVYHVHSMSLMRFGFKV